VSDMDTVNLLIDSSTVLATQEYVDDKLLEHEQSRRHPDATLKAKGFTQLSSATNSESEALSATPKAVKAAFDKALAADENAKTANDNAGKANENANTRLEKNKNLSDLPNKAQARKNLELGTAATSNVQTSQTDSALGAVMLVPAFGLGGTVPRLAAASGASYDNIPTNLPTGFYTHQVAGGPFAHSITLRQDGGGVTSDRHFIIPSQPTDKIAVRWDGGTAFAYQYFYTDKNKPTSEDVNSIARDGCRVAGFVNDNKAEPYMRHTTSNDVVRLLPISGGTVGNLIVQNQIQVGGIGNGVLNIGDTDSGLRSSKDSQVDLYANGKLMGFWNTTAFSFTGQIIPTNYSNFDAKYQEKGNYTPAGQAYTKAESDVRFQPKGSYTPAGQAYTKAESDTRYAKAVPFAGAGGVGTYTLVSTNTTQTLTFGKAMQGAKLAMLDANQHYYAGSSLAGTWIWLGHTLSIGGTWFFGMAYRSA
ncbi:MAG: tail fiber protein, partial [Enterobacterales bacterium]|nr:tail fiber protein [Enterobacterales bacterium]